MDIRFEWSATKARTNFKKHGVSFEEASTVFADPLAGIGQDPDHSYDEERQIVIGHSALGRLLLVSFMEREGTIRHLARDPPISTSAKDMKRPTSPKHPHGELRPEYGPEFFRGLQRNRFASKMKGRVVAVILDPDVAEVFDSSEAVNGFLRSAIVAMRKRRPRKATRKKRVV